MEKPLTWSFVICAAIAVAAAAGLRSLTTHSNIRLENVKTSALAFTTTQIDDPIPLLNEVLSTSISTTHFSYRYRALGNRDPDSRTVEAPDTPVTWNKDDQLYIKDLIVQPGTAVRIVTEGPTLSLHLHSDSGDCCALRIGAGKRVKINADDDAGRHSNSLILLHPSDPFVTLRCRSADCSIRFAPATIELADLITDLRADGVAFTQGDTRISDRQHAVTGIQSGRIEVVAQDLLRRTFSVRAAPLAIGTTLTFREKDPVLLNVGWDNHCLRVNGLVSKSRRVAIYSASDGDQSISPTLLEVMIVEPWHKTLLAIIASCATALASLWTLAVKGRGAGSPTGTPSPTDKH